MEGEEASSSSCFLCTKRPHSGDQSCELHWGDIPSRVDMSLTWLSQLSDILDCHSPGLQVSLHFGQ